MKDISTTQRILMAPRLAIVLFLLCAASICAAETATFVNVAAPSTLGALWNWSPFILKGFALNIVMSVLAMAIGTVLGGMLGLLQMSEVAIVRWMSSFFTQILRNTPWIVILFAVMLLVPFRIRVGGFEIFVPDWVKAVFGFALPVAANIAEVVRGGINSIPRTQWESAESLAFSKRQTLWMIIFPQCIKRMIPPWMNWYAILALSTPIAAILGVHESVGNAQQAMEAAGARPALLVPFYSFILLLFFLYIYPIARVTVWLEQKYAVKH